MESDGFRIVAPLTKRPYSPTFRSSLQRNLETPMLPLDTAARLRSAGEAALRPATGFAHTKASDFKVRFTPDLADALKFVATSTQALYGRRLSLATLCRAGLVMLTESTRKALDDDSGAEGVKLLETLKNASDIRKESASA